LAIVPAALTISEIPNSLRVSLQWPLVSILSGILIAQAQKKWFFIEIPVFIVCVVFAVGFLKFYFTDYKKISTGLFHDWVVKDAHNIKTSADWFNFLVKYRYKDFHTRYFLMNKRGESCMDSFEIWINVYNNLGRGKRY